MCAYSTFREINKTFWLRREVLYRIVTRRNVTIASLRHNRIVTSQSHYYVIISTEYFVCMK